MLTATICFSQSSRHDPVCSHIGTQNLWNQYATVGLLVVFEHRQPGASHGQAAAIQSVHELRLPFTFPAEANVGPARLKCLEIRTRRNLTEDLLPGKPNLQIVGLGGGKAGIRSAENH